MREYKPGQPLEDISAGALNVLNTGYWDNQVRITGEPPIEVQNTGGGPRIRFSANLGFWAKILKQDPTTGACSWVEQVVNEVGTFVDREDGRTGEPTVCPAYPTGYSANPGSFVPVQVPSYVWLRPGWLNQPGTTPAEGQEYLFNNWPSWTLVGVAINGIAAAECLGGSIAYTKDTVELQTFDDEALILPPTEGEPLEVKAYNLTFQEIPAGSVVSLSLDPFSNYYIATLQNEPCQSSSSSSNSATVQGVCVVADTTCEDGLNVTKGKLTASVTINGRVYPVDISLDTSVEACAPPENGCGFCLQPVADQPTSWTMSVSGMTGFYSEFNGDWTSGTGIGCFWQFTTTNPNLQAQFDLNIPQLLFIDMESEVEFTYGTSPGPYDCCAPMVLTLAGPNTGQAPSVTVVPSCGGG